ncbi:hypothetical protein AZ044_000246, partial [Pluralibacter gergoviae]
MGELSAGRAEPAGEDRNKAARQRPLRSGALLLKASLRLQEWLNVADPFTH